MEEVQESSKATFVYHMIVSSLVTVLISVSCIGWYTLNKLCTWTYDVKYLTMNRNFYVWYHVLLSLLLVMQQS